MNLGDVREKSVPKMTIVAPPKSGAPFQRARYPHRCHKTIGVLGGQRCNRHRYAGCLGHDIAHIPTGDAKSLDIEHPSGATTVIATLDNHQVTRRGPAHRAKDYGWNGVLNLMFDPLDLRRCNRVGYMHITIAGPSEFRNARMAAQYHLGLSRLFRQSKPTPNRGKIGPTKDRSSQGRTEAQVYEPRIHSHHRLKQRS